MVDLQALHRNYRLTCGAISACALAMTKVDACGHDAIRCAEALAAEADGFAVACIEEDLEPCKADIRQSILLLEGLFKASESELIAAHDFWRAVHCAWQLEAIERTSLDRPLDIWPKMDSGIHCVSFFLEDFCAAHERLRASGKVAKVVTMSRFPRADEPDCPHTEEQLAAFAAASQGLEGEVNLCNPPTMLDWSKVPSDWVRPDILLYGAAPFGREYSLANYSHLVMTLRSKVISVHDLPVGEPVGHGAYYSTERGQHIGVVAMGYADGHLQHAADGILVFIGGKSGRLTGRASMDVLTADSTDHPQAGLGSRVELWGPNVPVGALAAQFGSIPHQPLCNLKRVPRVYSGV